MEDSASSNGTPRNAAIAGAVIVALLLLLFLMRGCFPTSVMPVATDGASAPHPRQAGAMLSLGDAVMTGFSGTAVLETAQALQFAPRAVDRTFIDANGASARVFNPRNPGFVWDGRYWAAPRTHDIPAKAVGQVFGIAIDDLDAPNIYLAATSLYGLNIVVPPPLRGDGSRDLSKPWRRVKNGQRDAVWMAGQFGADGGPGTIWKIDGKSGRIVHFADVSFNGSPGAPAALGNLTYDPAHKQFFVSDLATGMIQRIGMDGKILGRFDHGVTGRLAAHLKPVAYRRAAHADIHDPAFATANPSTWGFAPAARRPFGLAVHGDRLYYAVADGQIWSVALDKYGAFTADLRWEIDVPDRAHAPPVSDIVFTHDGTLIAAQRAIVGTTYDYKALPANGVAHVYRFVREKPNNPLTPGAWYQQPEEYAVGFSGDSRNSAGGVALGYGYKDDGTIDFTGCEDALFLTGDLLRSFHAVQTGFAPTGPLQAYGLQVSPSGPVRSFNTPPAISYFVNYTDHMGSADARGTVGDVKVYRVDCKEPGCRTPSQNSPLTALPPAPSTKLAALPPGGVAPPGTPPGTPVECAPGSPGCSSPCIPGALGCGSPCTPGMPGCGGPCIPGTPGCGSPCLPGMPGCGGPCIPGTPGCDNTSAAMCMAVEATAICDTHTGQWTYQVTTTDPSGIGIDKITAYSATPGVSVSNGPDIAVSPGVIDLVGASGGQSVHINVCGFNAAARASGQPYDCCRKVLTVRVPTDVCTKTTPGGG